MTQIKDCMTQNCMWIAPTTTLNEAAKIMAEQNLGFLPVAENDRMVGMVTDRDMVTRAMAQNMNTAETQVQQAMTEKTYYCYDDQTAEEICQNMAELQIRRMPVVNREKRLVGAVSFGDLAQYAAEQQIGQAERQITWQVREKQQQAA
jgi:CBS domain-containing protein